MAIATNDDILMAPFLPVYRRMGAMGIPNGLHPVGMGPDGGHQGLRTGSDGVWMGSGSCRSAHLRMGSTGWTPGLEVISYRVLAIV